MSSEELFYKDSNGKKQDSGLHDEMLNDEDADKYGCLITASICLKDGETLDVVVKRYGVSEYELNSFWDADPYYRPKVINRIQESDTIGHSPKVFITTDEPDDIQPGDIWVEKE